MRISDWSSDVCSSDLIGGRARSGIDHAHLDRERQPPPVRSGHAIAVAISGGDGNLVPAARQADSFGRVLQQVEEYLDQPVAAAADRSEEHTSELQSLMRISYAVFCLKKKTKREKIQ